MSVPSQIDSLKLPDLRVWRSSFKKPFPLGGAVMADTNGESVSIPCPQCFHEHSGIVVSSLTVVMLRCAWFAVEREFADFLDPSPKLGVNHCLSPSSSRSNQSFPSRQSRLTVSEDT